MALKARGSSSVAIEVEEEKKRGKSHCCYSVPVDMMHLSLSVAGTQTRDWKVIMNRGLFGAQALEAEMSKIKASLLFLPPYVPWYVCTHSHTHIK